VDLRVRHIPTQSYGFHEYGFLAVAILAQGIWAAYSCHRTFLYNHS
jgi:hypothetical protein